MSLAVIQVQGENVSFKSLVQDSAFEFDDVAWQD